MFAFIKVYTIFKRAQYFFVDSCRLAFQKYKSKRPKRECFRINNVICFNFCKFYIFTLSSQDKMNEILRNFKMFQIIS